MKDKPINMSQAQKLKEVTNKGGHINISITKQKQDIAKTKHQKSNSTKCRPSWVSALKSLGGCANGKHRYASDNYGGKYFW